MKMKRRNAVHIFRGITIVILSIAVAAVIVMLLWNALIPSIIGWSTINYWQAAGLLILCRILFKGFGFPHPANTFRFNKEHIEMHDRMKHMTWDVWLNSTSKKHMNEKKSQKIGDNQNQYVSELFRKYQAQLKGFIAKRVPSKEDCEDILQNVFYQLAKINIETNPIEQVSAWLYSVTRNQIIDWSRKKREEALPEVHNNEEDQSFISELTGLLLDEDASPEMDFIRSLVWEELENAMNELPEEQSTIFKLTELEGFSFKEISESTGITVNTLISRKRYAVLHLRKRLARLYDELLNDN